jgi:hypothetical protein
MRRLSLNQLVAGQKSGPGGGGRTRPSLVLGRRVADLGARRDRLFGRLPPAIAARIDAVERSRLGRGQGACVFGQLDGSFADPRPWALVRERAISTLSSPSRRPTGASKTGWSADLSAAGFEVIRAEVSASPGGNTAAKCRNRRLYEALESVSVATSRALRSR